MATLHELQTIYSTEDAYDLCEIAATDDYNEINRRKADGDGSN
jgi:hypothetical protein